jgi:MFS family permease
VFFIRATLGASTSVFGLTSGTWTAGMLVGALLFGRLGRRWTHPGRLVRISPAGGRRRAGRRLPAGRTPGRT